jgi:hypothetical protein
LFCNEYNAPIGSPKNTAKYIHWFAREVDFWGSGSIRFLLANIEDYSQIVRLVSSIYAGWIIHWRRLKLLCWRAACPNKTALSA